MKTPNIFRRKTRSNFRLGDNKSVELNFHPEDELVEVLHINVTRNNNKHGDFYKVILALDNQIDGDHTVALVYIDKNAIKEGESYNSVTIDIPHNSDNDEYRLNWHSYDVPDDECQPNSELYYIPNDEIITKLDVWNHERIHDFVTQNVSSPRDSRDGKPIVDITELESDTIYELNCGYISLSQIQKAVKKHGHDWERVKDSLSIQQICRKYSDAVSNLISDWDDVLSDIVKAEINQIFEAKANAGIDEEVVNNAE